MGDVRLTPGSCMLEADRALLKYHSYQDYLDNLITVDDVRYMRSLRLARKLAELGFRISGDTLSKKEFLRRRKKIYNVDHPSYTVAPTISKLVRLGRDPLIEALAIRERACRVGILQTIVYVRVTRGRGGEVSAYIDYTDRLKKCRMIDFFTGHRRLLPMKIDMGYFDWKNKLVKFNETPNFEIIPRRSLGSVFRSKVDNLIIDPDPNLSTPGVNTYRQELDTENYSQCILFDHVVRNRGMHA